jgi:SAM-dependent methyltransferase
MNRTYSNKVYDVRSEDEARAIILTSIDGMSTEERWKTETPYLRELISSKIDCSRHILDYGCGVGRLSKAFIEACPGAWVIGADTSWSMRALANNYVRSERFLACPPPWLDGSYVTESAICVWVLQHCQKPQEDIDRISETLISGGELFVLNEMRRCVPVEGGLFESDDINIRDLLRDSFVEVAHGRVDERVMGARAASQAFWGVYRNKGHL